MMIDLNACYAFDEDDGDDSGPGSSKEETPKRLLNNILYMLFQHESKLFDNDKSNLIATF